MSRGDVCDNDHTGYYHHLPTTVDWVRKQTGLTPEKDGGSGGGATIVKGENKSELSRFAGCEFKADSDAKYSLYNVGKKRVMTPGIRFHRLDAEGKLEIIDDATKKLLTISDAENQILNGSKAVFMPKEEGSTRQQFKVGFASKKIFTDNRRARRQILCRL